MHVLKCMWTYLLCDFFNVNCPVVVVVIQHRDMHETIIAVVIIFAIALLVIAIAIHHLHFITGRRFVVQESRLRETRQRETSLQCRLAEELKCDLGFAAFSVPNSNLWYTITTQAYPTTVPLSLHRNRGKLQGRIDFTDSGLRLNRYGHYMVTASVILSNPSLNQIALIQFFLVENGATDMTTLTDPGTLGGVMIMVPGTTESVAVSGNLFCVKPGTTLSIVAANTNSVNPNPLPISVVAWEVSAVRISCLGCRICRSRICADANKNWL